MTEHGAGDPVEIERKFLLDGRPPIPASADVDHIEQGYLPDRVPGPDGAAEPASVDDDAMTGVPQIGRIRRRVRADGSEHLTHTIKRGHGLVREEHERTIDRAEFDAAWPRTAGARISKHRHTVTTEDGRVWEIDVFDDRELVLAEVELPTADAAAPPPAWLAPHIIREVTDEPSFTNRALAGDALG